MNLKRAIAGPLLALVFFVFFAYAIFGIQSFLGAQSLQANVSDAVENTPAVIPPPEINAISAISIESNLVDINKIIFAKEINVQLPIASLTKLMTAVIVLDNYNLMSTITVDSVADSQAPMKQDVKFGQALTVESLMDIMLIESSNRAAYALSEGPNGIPGEQNFVILMNKKAEEIGMKNTFFADPTGLSSQDVSTASDLVMFAEYILKNYSKIANISKAREFYVPGFGNVISTDQLLGEVPEVVCGKTGFTTAANGCLLLVVKNLKNNDYFINLVLGADDRFAEMRKIINYSSATCN